MPSGRFWETMNLLVGREYRRSGREVMEDVEDWVEKVIEQRESTGEECEEKQAKGKTEVVSSGYFSQSVDKEKDIEEFIKAVDLPKIECKFSHPHVTSRLEKLMGSNLVCLTDREYMQKLQKRILEDYAETMDKRIKVREHEETERVKNLVLSGRIPLSEAPESMADHPIMTIEKICKKLIAQRRAKIKVPKVNIPTHLYYDDTPDPPSGLSIENGHIFRKASEKLCNPASRFLSEDLDFDFEEVEVEEIENDEEEEGEYEDNNLGDNQQVEEEGEEEEEVTDEFMFTRKEYNKLKYESPLIKMLRKCETVEELYALADEIIGILKTLEDTDMTMRSRAASLASSVMEDSRPPSVHERESVSSQVSSKSAASRK